MSDDDDYLDSVLEHAADVIPDEAVRWREIVLRGRLAADLTRRIGDADVVARVVVRCPDKRCGRVSAEVYDTSEGPLYVATIKGEPGDVRASNAPRWTVLQRLLALPDEIVDDDVALVEAVHGAVNADRVLKNPPVMPWDSPPEVPTSTVHVLIDPSPLTPLWLRCPKAHPAVMVDAAELLQSYRAAVDAGRAGVGFKGTVTPL